MNSENQSYELIRMTPDQWEKARRLCRRRLSADDAVLRARITAEVKLIEARINLLHCKEQLRIAKQGKTL